MRSRRTARGSHRSATGKFSRPIRPSTASTDNSGDVRPPVGPESEANPPVPHALRGARWVSPALLITAPDRELHEATQPVAAQTPIARVRVEQREQEVPVEHGDECRTERLA